VTVPICAAQMIADGWVIFSASAVRPYHPYGSPLLGAPVWLEPYAMGKVLGQ